MISAFIPVYNEEERIAYALNSLQWCDEIVVVDKCSEDKTVEIAKNYNTTIYSIPNSKVYDAHEFDYIDKCNNDWIIVFTASDIIDKKLALIIKKTIENVSSNVGIIEVPFRDYILGLYNKRSPWHSKYKTVIFRKNILIKNYASVHSVLSFKKTTKIRINKKNGYLRHLTHKDIDIMLERHIRYCRAEGQNYQNMNLWPAFKHVLGALFLIFKRRTWSNGWDGIVLICAYLSYHLISFLYKWQHNHNHSDMIYKELREKNSQEWQK